jgi:hypothetical protein
VDRGRRDPAVRVGLELGSLLPLTEPYDGPNFEAWTMLAATAQATRRIRIGCQVTGKVRADAGPAAAPAGHHRRPG